MIPNSEERRVKAEYEYNRRQFLKLKTGRVRAWLVLALSIVLSIFCILLNRKYSAFTFSLVASTFCCFLPILICVAFLGAYLLRLYAIHLLITIWKEMHTKDEYTPFVTNSANPFSFDASSFLTANLKEVDHSGMTYGDRDPSMESNRDVSHWR